jgi:zinc D-Ala-D-Ala dipeptidase
MTILQRLMLTTGVLFLGACASPKPELRSAVVPSHAAAMAEFCDLVDVRRFIPDVAVDLRYATKDNIARRPLYPPDMPCLLRASTAEKLKQAQAILRTKGLGLRIWDAWRPPEVQVILVETDGNTGLFMDPKSAWSRHCSGTAVDVTLVDDRGVEQQMPTYHDEGGPAASYHYTGGSGKIHRNLYLLQRAMVDVGFRILDTEWWHFDDADYYVTPAPVVFGHEVGIRISDPQ